MDAADDIWNMDEFLEETLEVDNADMRDNLQNAGFMNLTTLRNKKWDFADSCCGVVRKGTGGNAATKNVPVTVQQGMKQLIMLVRLMYMCGRVLDYDLATLDNLEAVESWVDG